MIQKGYQTKTKQSILDYFYNHSHTAVTVADLDLFFNQENTPIDRSTIYRCLDRLLKQQLVLKFTTDDGKNSFYQYVGQNSHCHEHLHLKCTQCGKIIHLDCGFMDEIVTHILTKHDFHLQCESSILFGICKDCKDSSTTIQASCTPENHQS